MRLKHTTHERTNTCSESESITLSIIKTKPGLTTPEIVAEVERQYPSKYKPHTIAKALALLRDSSIRRSKDKFYPEEGI